MFGSGALLVQVYTRAGTLCSERKLVPDVVVCREGMPCIRPHQGTVCAPSTVCQLAWYNVRGGQARQVIAGGRCCATSCRCASAACIFTGAQLAKPPQP